MEAKKIRLIKEKETYLATLYGKALDAVEQPILGDRFAADAVAHIDYDFKKLKLPSEGEITRADAGLALRPVDASVPRCEPLLVFTPGAQAGLNRVRLSRGTIIAPQPIVPTDTLACRWTPQLGG